MMSLFTILLVVPIKHICC